MTSVVVHMKELFGSTLRLNFRMFSEELWAILYRNLIKSFGKVEVIFSDSSQGVSIYYNINILIGRQMEVWVVAWKKKYILKMKNKLYQVMKKTKVKFATMKMTILRTN